MSNTRFLIYQNSVQRDCVMGIVFDKSYYEKVIKENNYQNLGFKPIDFSLYSISQETLSFKWLCHHYGDKFKRQLEAGSESIVTTGVGISGPPHIGTLSQIMRAIYLQKCGAKVQFVLGDLDSYNARNKSLDEVKRLAQIYKDFIIALGFDDKKGILRTQFEKQEVLLTSYLISKGLTDKDFIDTEEDLSDLYKKQGIYPGIEFPIKQSILLMVADFMQLGMHDGYSNIMVMLGVEEHLYVQLAQKVLSNLNLKFTLSGIYSTVIKGFNNYPKMSKSIPESNISLQMTDKEIKKKIMDDDIQYSKPEESVVFQMMSAVSEFNEIELSNLYKACQNNTAEWKSTKSQYAEYLYKVCSLWRSHAKY